MKNCLTKSSALLFALLISLPFTAVAQQQPQ